MNIKKIITLILGTLLGCNLSADIFDVFTLSSNSVARTGIPILLPENTPKDFFRVMAGLPYDLQVLIAQRLLSTTFGGQANLTAATVRTLQGHAGITSVAWSPDGTQLATGAQDGTIKIWDTTSWQNIQTLQGHQGTIFSVAWSPDGTQLASASRNRVIKIWDTATWQNIQTLPLPYTVFSVAWSPDGKQLTSTSDDNTIKIFDTATWYNIQTLRGHTSYVGSVAWSPDGTKLASGSNDGTIKIWDTATWQNTQTLRGHTHYVTSVAWSPDGTKLASGSLDQTIKIWDTSTWQNIKTLQGHRGTIFSVAWSPDGIRLASGSADAAIKTWDTSSWQNIQTLRGHNAGITAVPWSPDGKLLASVLWDNTLQIWSLAHLLTKEEFDNLTLEQALFLILLYSKRTTFDHATRKPLSLKSLHEKLTHDEAQDIWDSFSKETRERIQKRYALKDANFTRDEILALKAERQLKMQHECEAQQLRRAYGQGERFAQKTQEELEIITPSGHHDY